VDAPRDVEAVRRVGRLAADAGSDRHGAAGANVLVFFLLVKGGADMSTRLRVINPLKASMIS